MWVITPFTLTPRAVSQIYVVDIPTHSSTSAHVHEQQQKIIQGLDTSFKSVSSGIWASGKQQVSLESKQDWGLHSSWERLSNSRCLLLAFGVAFQSWLALALL